MPKPNINLFNNEEIKAFFIGGVQRLSQEHRPRILTLVQFSSVAQSCPTLCDPMDCSMPGLPVHHQLPEFMQTHDIGLSNSRVRVPNHYAKFPLIFFQWFKKKKIHPNPVTFVTSDNRGISQTAGRSERCTPWPSLRLKLNGTPDLCLINTRLTATKLPSPDKAHTNPTASNNTDTGLRMFPSACDKSEKHISKKQKEYTNSQEGNKHFHNNLI